ncbi:S8 family serine peptidase [Nonomuraea sp. K274]|uniref:S8 family serine peptidase n=1 Tax=Nonomuraea cypriaca TaxID=1187855 RepID=A0A931F4G5_9ACTN|nr:S8 family serine peptidase [Nonomuraea cypriaca]MBF8192637.1 S8 family serine peptidase [Nonomuraea cypriaca]
MRLRPLIVCSIALALLPFSAPAYADDPPAAPSPTVSQDVPQEPPQETPQEEVPQQEPQEPQEKVEDGLGIDGETERAVVELTDPAQNTPVASQAMTESVDVVLQPQSQSFMVVEGTAEELAALAEDPRVTSIHRDRMYSPAEIGPNLTLIGADKAHAANHTGTGQAVAVLDTGVDLDHPWLAGRIVAEACFSAVEPGVESLCPNGTTEQIGPGAADAMTGKCLADGVNLCEHGTHVAGIAAGTGGVAPGAKIVPVQVFSRVNDADTCFGESSCLLAFESSLRLAMDYVAGLSEPIAAVNLSLGGQLSEGECDTSEEASIFKPKIDALLAKNIATVVAAGNEFFEGASYPACISSAVAVGANDNGDAIADFSNRGAIVDLFAPGVDVQSSVPDNQTAVHSGTSMATPHVAGALALMKSAAPDKPMADLINQLKTTGRPYVYDANGAQVTTPRLDLAAALTGAAQQPPVTQTPTAPDPTGSSGPSPEPEDPAAPEPEPSAEPVPLPTVTVTVTVTPKPAAVVCTRASKASAKMEAKTWAVEIHRSSGKISDTTLNCYLKLIGKSSKVFPELTKASSLGKAYRVLKNTKTSRARLDSALLTAWLNWAHGTNGTTTMTAAEKVRLSGKSSAAALKKATTNVLKKAK